MTRRRTGLSSLAVVSLGLALLLSSRAEAYPTYQAVNGSGDSCAECHPGFDAGFSGPLHSLHLTFSNSCTACHVNGSGTIPVPTHLDPPLNGNVGCVGCHGGDPGTGLGTDWGAGLRLHHTNAGAPADSMGLFCIDCHPSDPLPVPEDVAPLYYGDGSRTSQTDSCADNLDNDGDLAYDGNDDDCQAAGQCGDGVLDPGEDCDDGNTSGGDCCSATCAFEPSGSACGDPADTACDNPDSCDGAGTCQDNFEPPGSVCDDGAFCTVGEQCDGSGACGGGSPFECPAGEVCDEDLDQCVPPPDCSVDADCDDGMFCNGVETCSAGTCQSGTPPVCDDGIGCTIDRCDESTDACAFLPDDNLCPDDGMFCNGSEFCDPVSDCSSTGDPCPAGTVCNEATDICEQPPVVIDPRERCVVCHGEEGEDSDDLEEVHEEHVDKADCVVCHGVIPDLGSPRNLCFTCHEGGERGSIEEVHRKHTRKGLSCLECHGNSRPPVDIFGDPRETVCYLCHGDDAEEKLEKFSERPRSAHRKHVDKGLDCGSCHAQANLHQDNNPMLPKDDPWRAAARGQGGFSACGHCHYGVSAEGVFGDTFESGDLSEWSGTMPPSGSLTAGFLTTDGDDDDEHEGAREVHRKHLPEQAQWCYTCHDPSDVPDAPMMVWGVSACRVCHDDERYEDSYPFDIHERHAEESIKCYTCHATQPPLFDWPWD